MMTLDALRCFCAVIELRSFRLAAERVHRSQPAVSQQVKALESELGQTLLDRKTKTPTPAGAVAYERAVSVLRGADGLLRELADFDETVQHELRVGTSDTNALYFLPRYVKAFARKMPQTRLVVVSRSSEDVGKGIERDELDLGIVTFPVSREGLETLELFRQSFTLIVPRKHPLSNRRRVSLAQLRDERFVLLEEATRTGSLLRDHFTEHDFHPPVALDSGSFEVIKRYVREGVGLAFVPEMVVGKGDAGSLVKVNVPGLPEIHIGAIWRKGTYRTKAAAAFVELITSS